MQGRRIKNRSEEITQYALYNYRQIRKEFSGMGEWDEKYEETKGFLNRVECAVEKMKKVWISPSSVKSIVCGYEKDPVPLLYDVAVWSYLNEEKLSSVEIIGRLEKKYGIHAEPVDLSKMKKKVVALVAPYMGLD